MSERQITGRQVFAVTATAFGIIIAVNLVLAFQAVRTFPGVEVKNSYVASQSFDADRAAQQALGWQIDAGVDEGVLRLAITDRAGAAVEVSRLDATLGRATHVQDDREPAFRFDGAAYVAPVDLAPGNWNLRMQAMAADGTEFRQRVVLRVRSPG